MLKEQRIVLRNSGMIEPASVSSYESRGGYESLKKALNMKPQDIIKELEISKLRGRGGAGFPVFKKWNVVSGAVSDKKYVICNADEGEPGTNKDRLILGADPHSIIEGMAIAALAIGANEGYIYLRFEYPHLFPLIENAIDNAREAGYLGENILGNNFNFDIKLVSGGGAYICGEETALIESIEGRRGEPRFKPPYPGISGLYGKPTAVHNVETLANFAPIIQNGGEWFSKIGTENCTGTKVFTICGNSPKKGVVEYQMGTNLKDIFEAHGGVKDGELLGFMIGGQSGNLINKDQIDLQLDIDSCHKSGVVLGTGTIMVINDSSEILEIVENIMNFFIEECCGKCTPCREGNIRIYEIIKRIREGNGCMYDLELLEELSETMNVASLCGFGQSSSIAVISSMHNFKDDYLKAIERSKKS